MRRDWSSLIHYALTGVADDPYVRLLKERLRSGSQVVRIHLEKPRDGPEYVVILSLHRQLSEMRLPHSEAFTSWSLEAGARMADGGEETERFVLLLEERFTSLIRELGPHSFEPSFIHHIRALGPPKAVEAMRRLTPPAKIVSGMKDQATQRIEDVLVKLARALGRSLRYDEDSTARILDAALAQWLTRYFQGLEQELHAPR
jgi:hypothetical protein